MIPPQRSEIPTQSRAAKKQDGDGVNAEIKKFRGLKLYPVLLRLGDKKKRFWRVTKPRVGGGRTMKTYANQDEAETAFDEVQSVPVADFLYAINIILSPRSASTSMEPLRLTG